MASDAPLAPPPNGEAKHDPGLPTVTPPSGGMFLRLFGIPALIVGGVVLGLILLLPLVSKLFWGSPSPEQFLRDLDNSNAEVRWRAAEKLVQVLLRDDKLASDSDFALQLVKRLRHTLDTSAPLEKAHAERFAKLTPKEEAVELQKLDADRNYIFLLSQCLGRFLVPVGAPILEELATQESGLDPLALHTRRERALWALANLGDNLKRFDKLPTEQRQAILVQLQGVTGKSEQAVAAEAALTCLKGRQEGRPRAIGVDGAIETCADADDPLLRKTAALAATHWSGNDEENRRIESTLIRLCADSGKGAEEAAKREAENPENATRSLVKKPGFDVQAQAAIALAYHGWKVRLPLLQTMLDEDELRSIFVVQAKNGGDEKPDQAQVINTMLNALQAVVQLHERDPQRDLSSLRPSIDKLAQNANPAVRAEAEKTVLALNKS